MSARERPILFNAPMVRAILDDRKTLTRRVYRLPSGMEWYDDLGGEREGWYCDTGGRGWWHVSETACPYGRPGDRLWVKETYADLTATHGQPWERRNPDTGLYERGRKQFLWYRADGEQPEIGDGRSPVERWRPSIHMPRWASRIDLEVTGVRVERLQDISQADAIAEGPLQDEAGGWYSAGVAGNFASPVEAFRALWESVYGPESWTANPWVWVVEFRRIKP